MDERLKVETAIALMGASNQEDIDRLQTALNNYNLAKDRCEPYIADLKSGMQEINTLLRSAGLDAPFVLSYAEFDASLKAKKKYIDDIDNKRATARQTYISIEDSIKDNPGLTYGEVEAQKKESRKVWESYNEEYDQAWREYRGLLDKKDTINAEEFDAKCNTYEYLRDLIDGKLDSLSNISGIDERLANEIKIKAYSLTVYIESIKGKYEVINKSISVFQEISEKLGIQLVYDDNQELKATKEKVQEEEISRTTIFDIPEVQEEQKPVEMVTETPVLEEQFVDEETPEEEQTQTKTEETPEVIYLGDGEEPVEEQKNSYSRAGAGSSSIEPIEIPPVEELSSDLSDTPEADIEELLKIFKQPPKDEPPKPADKPEEKTKEEEVEEDILPPEVGADGLTDEMRKKIEEDKKTLDEKVPKGERFKITAERYARIKPYIAASLGIGAIASIPLYAMGGIPGLAIGASIGALQVAIQKIHNKSIMTIHDDKHGQGWIEPYERSKYLMDSSKFKKDGRHITYITSFMHIGAYELAKGFNSLRHKNKNEEGKKNKSANRAVKVYPVEEQLNDDKDLAYMAPEMKAALGVEPEDLGFHEAYTTGMGR